MDEYLEEDKSYERLLFEYKKYGSLVIGYDFDNTVFDFHKKGNTYNQVIKLLQDLTEIGCICVCWTASPDELFIRNYCHINKIPLHYFNKSPIDLGWDSKKPYFNALLDDRAGLIQVYNELSKLVKEIKNV